MKYASRIALSIAVASIVLFTSFGCETPIPKDALALTPQSMEWRQMQTRRFETDDEDLILLASASLLQDLGFTIDDTETDLGVIIASKKRSAINAGQVAASVIVAALMGAYVPYDKHQLFKASVVTRHVGETRQDIVVRVTFQRIVWGSDERIRLIERINTPEMYQEFYQKLSKSVFLEAHKI